MTSANGPLRVGIGGPVGAVIVGGAGAILITLAWARFFPELRLAKTFDPPETDEHPTGPAKEQTI